MASIEHVVKQGRGVISNVNFGENIGELLRANKEYFTKFLPTFSDFCINSAHTKERINTLNFLQKLILHLFVLSILVKIIHGSTVNWYHKSCLLTGFQL